MEPIGCDGDTDQGPLFLHSSKEHSREKGEQRGGRAH
jgi:hypothetical protein